MNYIFCSLFSLEEDLGKFEMPQSEDEAEDDKENKQNVKTKNVR